MITEKQWRPVLTLADLKKGDIVRRALDPHKSPFADYPVKYVSTKFIVVDNNGSPYLILQEGLTLEHYWY